MKTKAREKYSTEDVKNLQRLSSNLLHAVNFSRNEIEIVSALNNYRQFHTIEKNRIFHEKCREGKDFSYIYIFIIFQK